MSEQCRLCLSQVTKCEAISIRDVHLKEELDTVFRFSIDYEPDMPDLVCDDCHGTITHIITFNQQVWDNQQRLRNEAKESVVHPAEYLMQEDVCDVQLLETDDKQIKEEIISEELQIEFVQPILQPTNETNDDEEQDNDPAILERGSDEDTPEEQVPSQKETRKRCISKKAKKPDPEKPKKTRTKCNENDKIIEDFCTLECEICSAPSASFGELQKHYRREHDTRGYVRCCEKQYFDRSKLVDHIASHKGLSRCEICQRTYKSMRYLAQHMNESHSQLEDKPFKCSQCHKSYSREHLLRAHKLMHVKKQCEFCQKVLSNGYSLKLHIAQVHSGDGHQVCATCGKVFRTSFAMERHIRLTHQPQLVTWDQCKLCDRWFDCKENLKKHIRLRHEQSGEFPCDQCDHVSVNRRSLVFHKNRIHKQRKLYDCKHCGKQLLSQLALREHLAAHSNVPLYSCDFCEVTFNSSANKYKHYKAKHYNEWQELKQQRLVEKMIVPPPKKEPE